MHAEVVPRRQRWRAHDRSIGWPAHLLDVQLEARLAQDRLQPIVEHVPGDRGSLSRRTIISDCRRPLPPQRHGSYVPSLLYPQRITPTRLRQRAVNALQRKWPEDYYKKAVTIDRPDGGRFLVTFVLFVGEAAEVL
jgi:hypothetical protein